MYNTKFEDSAVFFLSYADNRHTHTERHANTHTHRPSAKNEIFGFRGPKNTLNHQNLF